ncbi:hypothetical protein JB92DRAFT_3082178 [Gautieria morchelliformis]|nr:hypothetical protein JB92DRAFT_3082178 [Gautieria morchelliformis]
MATASTPNPRASLLAGLRTGGVRSASQPQVPHTAAITGSFSVPRISNSHPSNSFPEEEEEDELSDIAAHSLSFNGHNFNSRQVPLTAAADGSVNNFQQQQQQLIMRQLAVQRASMSGGMPYATNADQTEMQAQMMQMEMLKYQAFHQAQQAQQYQAELIAQAQRQQQQQQQQMMMQQPSRGTLRRPSMEPMTAGPTVTSFDQRGNVAAQLRARAQQAEHRSALAAGDDHGPVPMTAAIGGKFASRMLNPQASSFVASRLGEQEDDTSIFVPTSISSPIPPTPPRTTVISGGTSLGTPTATAFNLPAPSKSDAAVSWRRGSAITNNSVLRSASATPPLITKLNQSSPSNEETSPTAKTRPQPLRFSVAVSSPLPAVSIDTSAVDEEVSSGSSKGSPTSTSTPSTPPSAHSSLSGEVKKPYEGVGMGRPAVATNGTMRHASLPSRQPRGPPSGADELGPRNFATRLRRKAIGGLGALVTARERRDMAIEIQAY